MGNKKTHISISLCYLLRHNPQSVGLDMDRHGWVSVAQLIDNVNAAGEHKLDAEKLQEIVATDEKGRYRFSEDGLRIKACQGHSISWVEPELEILPPPDCLYHGTTTEALQLIKASGAISKMKRHAVHLQDDFNKAWKSARRWKGKHPVVLKIDAAKMAQDGVEFAKSENDVWFCHEVPVEYIVEMIYSP